MAEGIQMMMMMMMLMMMMMMMITPMGRADRGGMGAQHGYRDWFWEGDFSKFQIYPLFCHMLSELRVIAHVKKWNTTKCVRAGCRRLWRDSTIRQCTCNVTYRLVRVSNICRGKAVSCTYSGIMFVTLYIQHSMHLLCLISVPCPAAQYFCTLYHKRHDFFKKIYWI